MGRKFQLLIAGIVLLLGSAVSAAADCYTYTNSHMYDYGIDQGGPSCVGTGGGCELCYYDPGPPYQGYVCGWNTATPWDDVCFFFGDPPDIQR
jgi:hypothetical protein